MPHRSPQRSPRTQLQALVNLVVHIVSKPQRLLTPDPRSPQMLYLRVNPRSLHPFPATTADQPNPQPPLPGTTGNSNVIAADLLDLRPFAGDAVDWLIQAARLIFEPLSTSSLCTFTAESLELWLDREMEHQRGGRWCMATRDHYLRVSSNGMFTALTKMTLHKAKSITTNASITPTTTFHHTLLQHHPTYIISKQPLQQILVTSHLIPRRLGDTGVQSAFQRFVGSSTIINGYDPLIGVPLLVTLRAGILELCPRKSPCITHSPLR